uniref:Uncharacterized protein n=1 Tax=Clytia hemisphaerica TaxID=252671 RepID=A0A7M5X030_9CNID
MIEVPIKAIPKAIQLATITSHKIVNECTEPKVSAVTERDLKNLVSEFEEKKDRLDVLVDSWLSQREELVKSVKAIAGQCDETHMDVNISNVASGVVGFVGASLGVTALSIALAPVTAGASVIAGFAIAGATVGLSGGAVGVGANIIGPWLIKKKCKEADELIKKDDIMTQEVQALSEEIEKISSTIESLKRRQHIDIGASSFGFAAKAAADIVEIVFCAKAIKSITTASQIIDGIVDVTKVAALAGSKTAMVFAVVGLAVSIGEIAWYSRKIDKKEKSEAGLSFMKIADNLTQQIAKIRQIKVTSDQSRTRSNAA